MSEIRKVRFSSVNDPLQAVRRRYMERYEFHAEQEQMLAGQDTKQAERHHGAALLLAWALSDEMDDIKPEGLA